MSRFMCIKFEVKNLLIGLFVSDNSIGEVIHYFWRLEYQSRSIQHCMIWIKDPELGKSEVEEVVTFIRKYVTCEIPDENVSSTNVISDNKCDQNYKYNSYAYEKNRYEYLQKVSIRFSSASY